MNTEITPSQLISYHQIPFGAAINKLCVGERHDFYGWYLKDGIYHAHRKPTVNEILANKFK